MSGPSFQTLDNPSSEKLPWWVKAVSFLGFPTVMAAYLIWVLVGNIDARVNDMHELMRSHQVDTTYLLKQNEEQVVQNRVLFRLLQQICVNTSKTAEDRATCWNPWK